LVAEYLRGLPQLAERTHQADKADCIGCDPANAARSQSFTETQTVERRICEIQRGVESRSDHDAEPVGMLLDELIEFASSGPVLVIPPICYACSLPLCHV
jgi:hypothetical protein